MTADITYGTAAIPTVTRRGRPAEPNPHVNGVKTLSLDVAEARTFLVRGGLDPKTNKTLAKHLSWLRAAGADQPFTVRTKITDDGDGETALVTFWAAPKQHRTRKPKDATEPASPATEGAPADDDADGPITEAHPDQDNAPELPESDEDTETPEHAPTARRRGRSTVAA